ncbi:MAG: hypothetical protein KGI80_00050 [Verrucomicrobiota bacterium]|nr:hypothetical protein [Verrucomicrobiota bacterium]
MKKWLLFLAVFSLGASPMIMDATEKKRSAILQGITQEQVIFAEEQGAEAVAAVREKFESGEYENFLEKAARGYEDALQDGAIETLGSMRPGISELLKEWGKQVNRLQQEKYGALRSLVDSQEFLLHKDPFLQKVLSAATDPTSSEEKRAIDLLGRFGQMMPGSGFSAEENLLIAIDLEYEYKAMHLDPASPIHREEQCALKMEKMQVMQSVAEQFKDADLKAAIALCAENLDARLAQSWDMADLQALVNGKKRAGTAMEEQIASLLMVYQDKLSDLTRQFIEGARDLSQ